MWESRRPAWIPDVVKDGNFRARRSPTPTACTARSGFLIVMGSRVLGVMEFFSQEIQEPDDELL